ncbi:hypothetical protein GWO43_30445 [candidate division KSB1 bacterium]|nr:hypothetical protein [candidate division KSB1 bacterium]NIR72686.1 hypothetical protein [candidate division KSB1 bacterium]NIS28213.1 hypothetical protein [candidate division KSB1 bacterium]NIT75103.1 hypothetical protein [candidate division KSB1 bacterium]NIU28889.1 hypothetical protein [candidate division KSB1 bacterium]
MNILSKRWKRLQNPFRKHPTPRPREPVWFLHPARIVLLSFLVVIIIGTGLLMLPNATVRGSISVVDALFTATSATCVTGLVVLDTGADFTRFGQIVILVLIQIGGLGIMTLSTFFVYLIAGRLTFTEREILQDTLSQHPMADFARLLKLVFLVTIAIEALGCGLLTWRFMQTTPASDALYTGLFHAVSGFCNAGFSLFSNSLENYRDDVVMNLVMSGLIVLGGLGFIVLFDLFHCLKKVRRRSVSQLSFHTRIVLFITVVLILSGTILFFGLENSNGLQTLSLRNRFLASFFQSVTTRTAGFNTVNINTLSNATLFFLILLMFIGASPGSCGGGIKTSTFAVIASSVFARFRMKEDVNIFYRRIPEAIVSRAISVVFFSIMIVVTFTMALLVAELPAISHTESRGLFLDYLFEVFSAFGTVGLSTGITSRLSEAGKVLITLLMFVGRLGPLTVALAVRGKDTGPSFRYVRENVLVG